MPGITDSQALWGEGRKGIVKPSLFPRGLRSWRTQSAGPAIAPPTPALTAARAPRTSWPRPSTPSSAAGGRNSRGLSSLGLHPPTPSSGFSGSPGLALQGVTIMRKTVACWTCGRTCLVWRLRERNFCSDKCRVRHHRSRAYRKPGPSKSSSN